MAIDFEHFVNEIDVLSTMILQLHENLDLLSNVGQGDISMFGRCFVVHVVNIHQFDRNVARRVLARVETRMELCSVLCKSVKSTKRKDLRLENSAVIAFANEVKETVLGK